MSAKVKSLAGIVKIAKRLKAQGKRIIFTNGCFDLLHYGHAMYLAQARKKGDCLIVGLNSDASVRRLKGRWRPIVPVRDRAMLLAALEPVDYVVVFGDDTPLSLIKALRPDVLVKGADWKKSEIVGAGFVQSYGGKVATVRLEPGRSTSAIISKIAHLATHTRR